MANKLCRFTATLVDDDGVKANLHQYVQIPEATTLTLLQTALNAWLTALNGLCDGGFTRTEAAMHINPDDLGLPTTPVGDEEAGEIGGFQYNLHGSSFSYTTAVPTLKDSVKAGGKIDITNAAVVAFDAVLAGAVETTGFYCSPSGLQFGTRRATFLGTRKHRQQQHAESYELG
jgi:hypothetical protein